jgi:electron transfer flavoprotein alpha subunit
MGNDILVVAERSKSGFDDVTFELLGKGRELAQAKGGALLVAMLGGSRALTGQLGAADKVLFVDHPALAEFNPEAAVAALLAVVDHAAPALVLVPNTSIGMDLAAPLSARKDLPLVAYAVDVKSEAGQVVATSQLYGGKVFAECVLEGAGVVSVLAGSFAASPGRKDGTPPVESVLPPAAVGASRVTFAGLVEPEGGDVDITQHDVLVAVGRGLKEADNLPLAEDLAKALGGVVCASRPIVDAKWLPRTRQVGKSGLKVKPKVYLTLGISGAPEHLEGMKDAELIIAVNTDANAPIFAHAHFGTTEDLFELVPALLAMVK